MSSSPSVDILAELESNTKSKIASLENRVNSKIDFEKSFSDIQNKFEEASKIKNDKDRDIKMKILQVELSQLREDAKKEEKDLAEAVFGLNAILESFGLEYSELGGKSPGEEKLIKDAETKLTEANFNLQKAQTKWFFKGSAIKKANSEIEESKSALELAKTEAKKMSRERLLAADMEGSLQEFTLRVEGTIRIMQKRLEQITEQLQVITVKKAGSFDVKNKSAQLLEKLDVELNQTEADLKNQEDLLPTFMNGTPEHTQQEQKISNLRALVEDLRGRRNTAFVLFQSKEKFVTELEIHERAMIKLRDNMKMWITSLRSDTEERVVTFKSRLEAMKAASDQDIAKQLDDVGSAVDENNAKYMAQVGAASDRLRMDKIEKHPERLKRMIEVQNAQAEAIQAIRRRESKAIEDFKAKYKIDPMPNSYFHYEEASS